jgi:hypothetical protein
MMQINIGQRTKLAEQAYAAFDFGGRVREAFSWRWSTRFVAVTRRVQITVKDPKAPRAFQHVLRTFVVHFRPDNTVLCSCVLDSDATVEQVLCEKATVEVFKVGQDWHPYPWRFAVTFQGVRHEFAGLPNQCATRRQASGRARWRARWLEDGTYAKRYS